MIIERIKANEDALRDQGVRALFLYGSHARDEAGPGSDIDILVELAPDQQGDLASYLAPYHLLRDQFPGIEIGYGTRDDIVPRYRPSIEQRAMRIF